MFLKLVMYKVSRLVPQRDCCVSRSCVCAFYLIFLILLFCPYVCVCVCVQSNNPVSTVTPQELTSSRGALLVSEACVNMHVCVCVRPTVKWLTAIIWTSISTPRWWRNTHTHALSYAVILGPHSQTMGCYNGGT